MSDAPTAGVPTEADLEAERAREERSERWLFIRQVAIVLVLVACWCCTRCSPEAFPAARLLPAYPEVPRRSPPGAALGRTPVAVAEAAHGLDRR